MEMKELKISSLSFMAGKLNIVEYDLGKGQQEHILIPNSRLSQSQAAQNILVEAGPGST